jgi:steroid delta-isomerase
MSREALAGLRRYWETLTLERVDLLDQVYAPDAYFRDPFNEVRGIAELRRIFRHMWEAMDDPRFRISETILEGDAAVLIWDFSFRVKRWRPEVTQTIHGLSHVRFSPDGRVTYHRDYWDAAGELYAKLPLVGPLMRYLARRMG